jgi:hypothetical protein
VDEETLNTVVGNCLALLDPEGVFGDSGSSEKS